jgi:hypothetical protein
MSAGDRKLTVASVSSPRQCRDSGLLNISGLVVLGDAAGHPTGRGWLAVPCCCSPLLPPSTFRSSHHSEPLLPTASDPCTNELPSSLSTTAQPPPRKKYLPKLPLLPPLARNLHPIPSPIQVLLDRPPRFELPLTCQAVQQHSALAAATQGCRTTPTRPRPPTSPSRGAALQLHSDGSSAALAIASRWSPRRMCLADIGWQGSCVALGRMRGGQAQGCQH